MSDQLFVWLLVRHNERSILIARASRFDNLLKQTSHLSVLFYEV